MKRIILLFFAAVTIFSTYSQTSLQDGDRCFENGDYTCAIAQYNEAFKSTSGRDKQIADLKLSRAQNCVKWIEAANQAFNSKNYTLARENYQKVLDSNSNDEYVKKQIDRCNDELNSPPLRKATTAELTDIWNNKYGIKSQRRKNLIAAGIDPNDAQRRVNAGEGKPQSQPAYSSQQKQETTLTVSPENITFKANGNRTIVDVTTNASDYQITYLPSWCKVRNQNSDWFSLACDANNTGQARSNLLIIKAGNKEVKINISQPSIVASNTNTYVSDNNSYKTKSKINKCFNCPNTNYKWGISVGYLSKYDEYNSFNLEGIQAGIRFEPLFKYGFGLDMGLYYEYTSTIFNGYNNDYDIETDYEEHVINIPLHLEYRFNFSKYFNVFVYGGIGVNAMVNSFYDDTNWRTNLEYGGGLRIDHIQFNVGQCRYINYSNYKNYYKYKGFISLSYMF